MSNNTFAAVLVGVLVVGAAVGAAFFVGLTIGKGQETDAQVVTLAAPQSPQGDGNVITTQVQVESAEGTPPGGTESVVSRSQIQVEGGAGASEEVVAQIRRQIQEQLGGGAGGGGLGGGFGGLFGTIESVEGNTITLDTPQGTLVAAVGDDTTIQMTTEVPLAELAAGMTVTMGGERAEDGTFQASNVFVVPEGGAAGPFGRFPGGRSGFGGGVGGAGRAGGGQ